MPCQAGWRRQSHRDLALLLVQCVSSYLVPPNSDEWRPFFHGFSLTRASRGDGAAADFRVITGPGRLLSLPLDSSDASATSAFDRVSCKTQLQADAKRSLASYPRPSVGHRVLTSALRTVDAREIRNFTRRAPNHLFAKTDLRKNAQGRRRNPMPEVSRGRDGRRQSEPRPHRRAAAEPPVVIPFPDVACTYCRAEAWPDPRDKNVCILTTYPAANRRSKSAHN